MPTLNRPDGAEIVFYDEGKTDGEVVLLVMGLGYPAAMWFRVVPALTDRYRVLRVDNRGSGRTGDVLGGPYSVPMMADDALAVLDEVGVSRAHVVSISMGGLIGQEIALSHPERVQSLMLMDTHAGAAHAVWDQEALALLGDRGEKTPLEAAEASIPFNYAPSTSRELIEEDWAVRLPLAATPAGYMNQLVGSSAWVGLDRLPGLTPPTMVVHGEIDRLVPPANGRMIADAIPDAELIMIPDANHLVVTDQTATVNALLLGWLGRHSDKA